MKGLYPIVRRKLPEGVRLDPNLYVTMRDGIKLAVDVYRPEAEGRYPGILSMSPYIKEMQQESPHLSHSIEAGATGFFVPKGYAHVIATVRGSGFSQGQYNYYDLREQQDGYDLIEWIARQPWCNGSVGMLGDSYFGKTQYTVAGQKPPHLKCIVPYDAGTDQYRDVVYQGGVFWAQFLGMWAPDAIQQCLWPGPVEGKLPPANFLNELLSHPEDGSYHWERSAWTKIDKVDVPVLNIVALTAVHSRGQLYSYPQIHSPKKLLVVPRPDWLANVLFVNSKPLNEQILRWFDYWLKGVDTGIMKEPSVTIFDSGTFEWRHENEYPLARTQWTKFYLHSNPQGGSIRPPYGLINRDPPGSEDPDRYTTPNQEAVLAGKPGIALAYATSPLAEQVRLWGPLSITLFGSTTGLDTVWFVKLGDIGPEGEVTLLTQGHLKASFVEIDEAKSKPGQPFHPFQNPVLPKAKSVYEYRIEMMPIFHTFRRGHKIWVQIASDDYEYQGKLRSLYIYEGLPVPGENVVYHDPAHPSHLVLPVIPDAPVIKPVGPPISEIKWPV